MNFLVYRISMRLKTRLVLYAKCLAKTMTFLMCALLYLFVIKMTILKPKHELEKEVLPDENETKRMNAWASNYHEWKYRNVLDNLTEAEYDALLSEYEQRSRLVAATCRKYKLAHAPAPARVNSKEFFIAQSHGLVWCNIFKAASSSWMYNINILGGYSAKFLSRTHQTPLTLARKKFPRPSEKEVLRVNSESNTISFLIVREPFERLLSAYRDKLEHHPQLYYRNLARIIIGQYRQKIDPNKTKDPTFREFVKYITENYKKRGDDFVFDEHWAPYYKFCTPCLLKFKMVLKVETFERDNEFILRELGVNRILERPAEKKTRVKTIMNKSRDGRNTTALLRHYYKTINTKMLNDLLSIYKVDFEMFGYNADIYRQYVTD